MESPEQVKLLI
jgi:hypothetical protein